MIGEPSSTTGPPTEQQINGGNDKKTVREKSGGKDGKESAVWYEYGCV